IRRVVMGEQAVGSEATEAQIDAMAALLRDCLRGGAFGFSSSHQRVHNDGDGNPVPSRFANHDELVSLARVVGEFPGTILEFIPGIIPLSDEKLDLMCDMSLAAGRPLNWNSLNPTVDVWGLVEQTLRAHAALRDRGARVVPLTFPAPLCFYLNLGPGIGAYGALPGWAPLIATTV